MSGMGLGMEMCQIEHLYDGGKREVAMGMGAMTRPGKLRVEVPRVSERGVQLREGEEGEVDGCRDITTVF
jgi:hypothetical protein